jgi:hypothetical protein
MREPSLCDRIIKLDRSIRFVGIVNNRGEVIEGGFKQGVEPMLNGTDEQQMYPLVIEPHDAPILQG